MSQIPGHEEKHEAHRSEILQALNWRYATKQFDANRKISDADWHVLEESLRLAPSSYGLQAWKFLVVQSPEVRKQLTPISWNQPQIQACSHYVVLCAHRKVDEKHIEKYIQKIAATRGVPAEQLAAFKNAMIGDVVKGPRSEVAQFWAARQTYIAMGFLLETAGLLNIDACPLEGLDPLAYDQVLGLKDTSYATVAAVALGYRSEADVLAKAKKVRFDSSDVIQFL